MTVRWWHIFQNMSDHKLKKKMSNKKILFLLDYYSDKITPFLYEWKPFLIIL